MKKIVAALSSLVLLGSVLIGCAPVSQPEGYLYPIYAGQCVRVQYPGTLSTVRKCNYTYKGVHYYEFPYGTGIYPV